MRIIAHDTEFCLKNPEAAILRMNPMRLQKFLSAAGFCSRRKGEQYIREGLVRVNGKPATVLGTRVDPDADLVEVEGKAIRIEKKLVYLALNKPPGYISSCRQSKARIVLDLIDIPERVYPVGRLDKDSTGLLLLTNDGRLHQRLTHPSYDHEKEYEVTVARPISDGMLRRMEAGMPMDGKTTRTSTTEKLSSNRFRIVLKEGKKRQIRRMVEQAGNQVVELKRTRMSTIRLGTLAEGKWRPLTEKEKAALLKDL